MARESLAVRVADGLLDRVIEGELAPGEWLPPESVLADQFGVSRLTVREALKRLAALRVVSTSQGRGSEVNPIAQWTSINAVVRASAAGATDAETSVQMLEMRRIIEVGAAELAAPRRTAADVEALRVHLAEMRAANVVGDVDGFVEADLDFHDVILRASGNLLVPALYDPIRPMLASKRRETSAVPRIQVNAIEKHERIVDAMASGVAEPSRRAMSDHMDQTLQDLKTFVVRAAD